MQSATMYRPEGEGRMPRPPPLHNKGPPQSPRRMPPGPGARGPTPGSEMPYRPHPHDRGPPPRPPINTGAYSPRWDSKGGQSALTSPTSPTHPPQTYNDPHFQPSDPRYPPRGRNGPPGPPRTRHDSPSRRQPLASKNSLPDMRSQDGVANFSRPRNTSINHPEPPYRQRPAPLPSPSENRPQYFDQAPPTSPWQRSRNPSMSSTYSSATQSSLGVPSSVDYHGPEPRSPRVRRGPPPSAPPVRPPFGYNNRQHSSYSAASAPVHSGHGPWLGDDQGRSSFRSQRTISTSPGTVATERSSVLTGRTSLTSAEPNADEMSIDDVMDMYEVGFDQRISQNSESPQHPPIPGAPQQHLPVPPPEPSQSSHTRQPSPLSHPSINIRDEERSLPMNLMDRNRRPSAIKVDDDSDNESLKLPPRRNDIDAEIRRSKLIFASPDFMASIPHIVGGQDHDEDEEDVKKPKLKRDSGKSIQRDGFPMMQDPEQMPPPPVPEPMLSRPTTSDSFPSYEPTPNPSTPSSPTAPKSGPPPIIDPDPSSRDRYGFRKETQYVSRQQYESWHKGYNEYLARRRKKWVAFLKENALMTDQPNRFPALSPKTRRFVRKGIPPDWRGAAWFYYAGGPAILSKHAGLYDQLLYKQAKRVDADAIERDLHRTFPDNIKFKPPGTVDPGSGSDNVSIKSDNSEGVTGTDDEPAMISALRRVLWAFSIYNPHIGYCQSLNFIAGMLLLFVETEEQTFWLLNVITRVYLPGTHELSLEGSKVDLSVLMTELRSSMPHIWDKIGGELDNGESVPTNRPQTSRSLRRPTRSRKNLPSLSSERLPPITLSMTAWFMSCYIGTLPVETTLRVWDVFFCEGSKTLFNVALAIFKLGESEIKAVKDPMEMFGVVQSMPRSMIDANLLIEACFKKKNGIANLSQAAIESRRQERRAKALLERQQHMSTPTGRDGGTVGEDGRKGTLFGKKKRSISRTRGAQKA